MRILLVDGDRRIAHFLFNSLREVGYAVDLSFDGKKGLYYASINWYDLILMDLDLPIIGGAEICRELRKDGRNFPIIILSAVSDMDSKIKILELGADDYVLKPFSLDELMARIRAVLRRPYNLNCTIQRIGKYIIDLRGRTLFENDKEIRLTKKEFSLLEYLVFNKNEVVSRGYIMEHVWDMNTDPFSNTVETHIRNLRRKLGDHRDKKIIVTIPGVGYKICCD
jgi:DNA-binding response OmpR family regulator